MRIWNAPLTALVTAAMLAGGLAVTQPAAARTAFAQPAPAHTARVPWSKVGPGWVLVQYTKQHPEGGAAGAVTLYLISSQGTKYQVAHWPNSNTAPQLLAWSPDGTRALFQVFTGKGGVEELNLAAGRSATFEMAGIANPVGYTLPSGREIVANQPAGSTLRIARYSLTGAFVHSLGTSADGRVLYAPSGAEFVAVAGPALELVSNNGTLIRRLPVPGASPATCGAARWWTAGIVLAACAQRGQAAPQLWLVPVSGARPTRLTAPRGPNSPDLGDLDAWKLSSGLYVQAAGPCGVLQIFKQAANGSITLVTVPHTLGDNHVLTALGSRLLVQAPTSCTGSNSLLWFDPGTRSEQYLIKSPGNVIGVSMAIPFYSRQNASF